MTETIDSPVMCAGALGGRAQAARLNRECLCEVVDHQRLQAALSAGMSADASLHHTHPHLFSDVRVHVAASELRAMAQLIEAIERVVALPAWKARALAQAPAIANYEPAALGAFLGYDFHLSERGPQLIEINTNAGGGLLNAHMLQAQRVACEHAADWRPSLAVAEDFVAMFREEWRRSRGDKPLRRIAIVDEVPESQFLLPEFRLFRQLFIASGIDAVIADPRELVLKDGQLHCGEVEIDLVYNRLTDFSLEEGQNAVLREAYLADAVLLTPHPHAHAIYADKRNLVALSDTEWLCSIGVSAADRAILAAGVPLAALLTLENADAFWASRRQWFFKPAAGYGGKAAYRGDKLTTRVFGEISAGGYIAQALVPPSERQVSVEGAVRSLKLDIRNFVYQGKVQLVSARLYQGQTTNFRTHGGGFAAVQAV